MSPPVLDDQPRFLSPRFHGTDDRETAERWLAELAAVRLPQSSANES